jgi:hypothetical protein
MLGSKSRWDTKRCALYGALLGLVAGMMRNLFDAFWGQVPEDNKATHILFAMVTFVLAGASLLAAISAVRNWLLREA